MLLNSTMIQLNESDCSEESLGSSLEFILWMVIQKFGVSFELEKMIWSSRQSDWSRQEELKYFVFYWNSWKIFQQLTYKCKIGRYGGFKSRKWETDIRMKKWNCVRNAVCWSEQYYQTSGGFTCGERCRNGNANTSNRFEGTCAEFAHFLQKIFTFRNVPCA